MSELARILLVEDDPRDVELTLTALGEYNLANEVVVTRDGEKALDYLYCRGEFSSRSNDNPAVMLLDLKLPKVDGLQVLQQIRSEERLKLIPVVVLTSSREEKDMVRSYKLGVNAYVVKPVDFHEFVNAIKESFKSFLKRIISSVKSPASKPAPSSWPLSKTVDLTWFSPITNFLRSTAFPH
jgi:DNA-binding response OmpR family regulator